MIAAIGEFIKNIVIFLIFSAFIDMILPNNEYKKYINIVVGLILMILIIQPVSKLLFQNQTDFERMIFHRNMEMNQKSIQHQKKIYEDQQNQWIIKSYKDQLEKQTKMLLSTHISRPISELSIEVNEDAHTDQFGMINKILLTVHVDSSAQSTKKLSKDSVRPIEKIVIQSQQPTSSSSIKDVESLLLEKNIKNLLANFYNLSSDNIIITVQKN